MAYKPPNISFLERLDWLPSKISIHGSTRIQFYGGSGYKVKTTYLSPGFVFSTQGSSSHLDLRLNYHTDPIVIVLWYRGIPLQKIIINNIVRDVLVFSTGLSLRSLIFQYRYDFTISELSIRSEGAHEVGIQYMFSPRTKPGKLKLSDKLIPYPSYIPYDLGMKK